MMSSIKYSLILIIIINICGCREKQHQQNTPDTPTISIPEEAKAQNNYHDTVKIDYNANRLILDVLPLLPDSIFKTWEWKTAERESMLKMIKEHGWFIDTTKDYNNIRKITPNYFETQVVDGTFSLASYRVENDDYIFLIKNQVGDGKNMAAYEYASGRFSELNVDFLLGVVNLYFMSQPNNADCEKVVEDASPYFDYDLETKNVITITAPLNKKQSEECLKGNMLQLQFNAATKKFDVTQTTWNIAP